jgi:hypothetical protein
MGWWVFRTHPYHESKADEVARFAVLYTPQAVTVVSNAPLAGDER